MPNTMDDVVIFDVHEASIPPARKRLSEEVCDELNLRLNQEKKQLRTLPIISDDEDDEENRIYPGVDKDLDPKVTGMIHQINLAKSESCHFSDGDMKWTVTENVRGKDAYIFLQYTPEVGKNLYELALLLNSIKSGSCQRMTVIMPLMYGSRGERRGRPKESINSVVVAKILKAMGVNRVATIDVHTQVIGSIYDALDMHFDSLALEPMYAKYFAGIIKKHPDYDCAFFSPDAGGMIRNQEVVSTIRNELDINIDYKNMGMILKHRPKPNESYIYGVVGNVEGKIVFTLDDMNDTGGTWFNGITTLKERGAVKIYSAFSHGINSGKAEERIFQAFDENLLEELIFSDSVAISERLRNHPRVKILPCAPTLADYVCQIHLNGSVSKLHDYKHMENLYKDCKLFK